MVFVGNGVALEDYVDQRGFMTGKSRAAGVTKSILRDQAFSEIQDLDLENGDERTGTFDTRLFLFYDLWPWLQHGSSENATSFLQGYILTVDPLIVNTYSKPASSIARANFLHEFGLPRSDTFLEHVGELSIQYYSNKCWVHEGSEGPDHDTACIVIPHIDPGLDKYGGMEKSAELCRLLHMTMQITFLVASTAFDVGEDIDPDDELTRFQICERVVGLVKEKLETTPEGKEFFAAFQEAKNDLKMCLAKRRIVPDPISERSRFGIESEELVAKIGFARGMPHSDSKRRLATTLERRHL